MTDAIRPDNARTIDLAELRELETKFAGLLVPISMETKRPYHKNWPERTFAAEDFSVRDSVGLKLGTGDKPIADVDCDSDEAVAAAPDILMTTPAVFGRPGRERSHYLYRVDFSRDAEPAPKDFALKTRKIGGLVELRYTGAQTVLPPSPHDTGARAWSTAGVPAAIGPWHLFQLWRLLVVTATLMRYAPLEKSGTCNEFVLASTGLLSGVGLDRVRTMRVLQCVQKWRGYDAAKVHDAIGRTFERAEDDSPITGGRKLVELIGDAPVSAIRRLFADGKRRDVVDQMNARHFIVRVGADEVIGLEEDDMVFFQGISDFKLRYANKVISLDRPGGGEPINKTWADYWLTHAQRREYRTMTFAPPPERSHPDDFNLFKGFAVVPSADATGTGCGRYLSHIRDVVCANEEPAVAEFLLDVMARKVQSPGELTEVAVVLRGVQGCGKGTMVEEYAALFGRHAVTLDKTGLAVGRFNGALSAKLVVCLDEALWPGHQEFKGALKSLVTNRTILIERKGIDPIEERNFVQLFVSTNNDWAWPFETSDRRALVLDVSSAKKGDQAYFQELRDEMNTGGRAALLAFLLARSITHDLRRIPRTTASAEQLLQSMDSITAWWYEKLARGTTWPEGEVWEEYISSKDAFEDYVARCKITSTRSVQEAKFVHEFRKLLPYIETTDRPFLDRDLQLLDRRSGRDADEVVIVGPRRMRRRRATRVPPLAVCRDHFARQVTRAPISWSEPDGSAA